MIRTRRHPVLLTVPALMGIGLLLLPLLALLVRTPWTRMSALLTEGPVQEALWLSIRCATAATALSLLVGVPLAWLLARSALPGRRVLRGLVALPLVLPPVVGGVALLLAFGRNGVLGPLLVAGGAVPAFTTTGVIIAETFVALPFLVLTVEGALAGLPRDHEEVAGTLGAKPLRVFLSVTLPAIGPSVLAGAVLAGARALGEFGATITFAGSLSGQTQTVPLEIYQLLDDDPPAAYALSAVLLLVSAAMVLALRSWRR